MVKPQDYMNSEESTWCPGCGNYGILSALRRALLELGLEPHEVILVSGIGCGSKLPHYMRVNGLHTLHGRPVAAAQGIKLANHDLKVVVTSGDGDSYGIGTGHFVHAMRRNADITHMVQNNRVYGLTKGQYSPTSEKGFVTSTTPEGAVEPALNPLAAALAHGSTFVARGSAGEPVHLANLMARAIEHRGHALVDILQPCVVFNRDADYDFYRERTYKLEDTEHDPENLDQAWQKAQELGQKLPIGLFFRGERPSYHEQVSALQEGPLVKQELAEPGDYEELKQLYL